MPTDRAALSEFITEHTRGTLATIRRSGVPQLSTVSYSFDPREQCVRISVTADRAKVANLRRDPRASIHVSSTDGWNYAVAEGRVELSPVAAATTEDDTVSELIDLYRDVLGEHPDWDDFARAMVDDKRLVIRLYAEHLYGRIG
ncbi:PPOX class F420-dependent oxidoreductase [Williamsia sp. D3]|uniref:PPOX class F420-dependent oxidoreductase n=1 Tax=Williamsia sp. D3 TaxID=1313067 RepID=UPI0004CF9D80|nr:PPOX class F420-dependent oxidoreductase [Williamsia sp. D3]